MTDRRPEVWELLKESRRGHYYCEDSWYSCPLAEGGCADARQPKAKCNCGASEWNARVEAALAAPPIEPVGMREALQRIQGITLGLEGSAPHIICQIYDVAQAALTAYDASLLTTEAHDGV